jgi:hypothetical protein
MMARTSLGGMRWPNEQHLRYVIPAARVELLLVALPAPYPVTPMTNRI